MSNEPMPPTFMIIPQVSRVTGEITAFVVQDPALTTSGTFSARRQFIVSEILKRYPAVTPDDLEKAAFNFFRFKAVITLNKTTKAGSKQTQPLTDEEILRQAEEVKKQDDNLSAL
jgi:hypothetical protein